MSAPATGTPVLKEVDLKVGSIARYLPSKTERSDRYSRQLAKIVGTEHQSDGSMKYVIEFDDGTTKKVSATSLLPKI